MKSLILTMKTWNPLLLCPNYVSLIFRAVPHEVEKNKSFFKVLNFYNQTHEFSAAAAPRAAAAAPPTNYGQNLRPPTCC
jgi:hypothetical protein